MADRRPPSVGSDQPYTAYYCEENIYLLAQTFESPEIFDHWETFVVIISNDTKSVALWGQRAGTAPFPVVWDYHVVLVIRRRQPGVPPTSDSHWVYDFDSVFGIPSPWKEYMQRTFCPDFFDRLPNQYRSRFRVLPARLFLEAFASDQSHMISNASEAQLPDGSPVYLKPIPPYPPLKGSKAAVAHNLDRFIKMTDDDDLGMCLSDTEFFAWGGGVEIESPAQVSDEDFGPAHE